MRIDKEIYDLLLRLKSFGGFFELSDNDVISFRICIIPPLPVIRGGAGLAGVHLHLKGNRPF